MKGRTVGFLSGTVFGAALALPAGFYLGVKGFMLMLEDRYPRVHKELKYRIRTDGVSAYYEHE